VLLPHGATDVAAGLPGIDPAVIDQGGHDDGENSASPTSRE